MPNDPTLYPNIPNPNQRLYERLAQLEARIAAVEMRRDIYIYALDGGGDSFVYHGGRTWLLAFGTATDLNDGGGVAILKANGANLDSVSAADTMNFGATELQFSDPTGPPVLGRIPAAPGDNVNVGISTTGTAWVGASTSWTILVIEWPQA